MADIVFLWPWSHGSSARSATQDWGFAVFDGYLAAIARLRQAGLPAVIWSVDRSRPERVVSPRQGLAYRWISDRAEIPAALRIAQPAAVIFHHHPRADLAALHMAVEIDAFTVLRLTASPERGFIPTNLDLYLVDHTYQIGALVARGVDADKIVVAAPAPDIERFQPRSGEPDFDLVYPAGDGFGSKKRIELAVATAAEAELTLCITGAAPTGRWNRAVCPDPAGLRGWLAAAWARDPSPARRYPWVSWTGFLPAEELVDTIGRARCLLYTADARVVAPRAIAEAAACGLPCVVCSDSPAAVSVAHALGGYIAPPTPEDLTAAIRQALTERRDFRAALLDSELHPDPLGPALLPYLRRALTARGD